MVNQQYQHSELTEAIIGCALKMHGTLGCGFPEIIYQRSLAIELQLAEVPFVRELEQPVYYRDTQVGSRRVDFLVADTVLVELKAASDILPLHTVQVLNYLTAYRLPVALILNFGQPSPAIKRLVK
jgi:GxxExxY protein